VKNVDKSTVTGIILAIAGIVSGLLLEGGKIAQILQPTAAMIVFGGTLGAVLVQFPLPVFIAAFKHLATVFFEKREDSTGQVQELVRYAIKARKEGIVSLDSELPNVRDEFLRKSLMLAVDGTEPQELRKMMELDLDNKAEQESHIPKVFESLADSRLPSASSAPYLA
jgi:chemotaxis protein MotA